MINMIDTKKHTKQILCDSEFERYNFGSNAHVVSHTPWNTQDPARFSKNVKIAIHGSQTDLDEEESEEESELVTLFVKFTADGKVQDAYALMVSTGEKIGHRVEFPAHGAAAGAGAGLHNSARDPQNAGIQNESTQDVRSTVATYLKSVGFVIDIQDPFTGLGRKAFDSAVGVKTAQVYFRKYSDGDGFVMSAEMDSEGRNCLSTCMGFIQAGANESSVIQTAGKFAQDIEKEVAASYAVRLHSRRPRLR